MADTLRELGIRIDAQEDVKPADVQKAYKEEIASVKERYKKLGKDENSPEVKRHILWLEQTRERLLKKLKEETDDVKRKTSGFRKRLLREINHSLAMRDRLKTAVEEEKKRSERIEAAIAKAEGMSDPAASGARIDDYEGWDWPWAGGLEDENVNNKTRNTLSGWLAAFQLHGASHASEQFQQAVNAFEKSWGWTDWDASLDYDDMIKEMKMNDQLGFVQRFNLAPEAQGYLAGHLAVAKAHLNEGQSVAYRDYLLAKVDSLKNELEKKPGGSEPFRLEYDKGRHQLKVLAALMTPKEWVSKQAKVGQEFEDLKKTAEELETGLAKEGFEFRFSDAWLRTFLGKSKEDITMADVEDIDKANRMIREEVHKKLEKLHKELEETYADLEKKAKKLIERNEEVEHFSDEDIAVLKKRLEYAKENIDKISVDSADRIEEMVTALKQVKTSVGYMEKSVLGKLQEMTKELDDAEEEKEEKEEEEEKSKKRDRKVVKRGGAAAAGGGGGGGSRGSRGSGTGKKKASDAEKRERREAMTSLAEFVNEKNLSAELVGTDYHYSLDVPRYEFTESQPIIAHFGNADVERTMGKKFNAYLKGRGKVLFTKAVREEIKRLSKKPDFNFGMVADYIEKNVKAPAAKKEKYRLGKIVDLFSRALEDSTMKFDTRPSRAGLEQAYKDTFVPAWERAGRDFDALMGLKGSKFEAKKEAGINTTNSKLLGAAIEVRSILGEDVYLDYAEGLRQLAYHGDDPEGVQFTLPYQPTGVIRCHFMKQGSGYRMVYPGGSFRYGSIKEAMRHINNGLLHRRYMDRVLKNEKNYEKYEDQIGTPDENEPGDDPRERMLELDWTNPDAQIAVTAFKHGRIGYQVVRENIGPHGEDTRDMFANSFQDFMKQLRHLRKWAEGPKHPSRPTLRARKEVMFNALTNPYTFKKESVQGKMGRIAHFQMMNNETVRMKLDWGGGNNRYSKLNATLNARITSGGDLLFDLSDPKGGFLAKSEKAETINAMIQRVAALKRGRA